MPKQDHEQLADSLEHEAADMAHQSEKLENDISHARQDWEQKRSDPAVPGANPPEGEPEEPGPEEPSEVPGAEGEGPGPS